MLLTILSNWWVFFFLTYKKKPNKITIKKYQKEIQTPDATKRSFKHTADSTFREAEEAELMIFSG